MNQTPRPRLLTTTEVANIFGVNPKTVRRWAQTRTLPTIRTIGGHLRFPHDEVEALLRQGHEERQPSS